MNNKHQQLKMFFITKQNNFFFMIQKIYFSLSDTFAAFSMRAEASSSLPLAISHRGDSTVHQMTSFKGTMSQDFRPFLLGKTQAHYENP